MLLSLSSRVLGQQLHVSMQAVTLDFVAAPLLRTVCACCATTHIADAAPPAACRVHSITINPPVYGADTPQSFFDEKLPYGWNLRNLGGCLLKKYGVPDIPGVTTPMTYFGMWKSFFSWHVVSAVPQSVPSAPCFCWFNGIVHST